MSTGLLKSLFPLLLVSSVGFAQSFRVGVEGGVPLTDAFSAKTASYTPVQVGTEVVTSYFSKTRRYTVGATAELGLPFHLAIKVDALYKRLGFDFLSQTIPVAGTPATTSGPTTANSFEFPLMAKYRVSRLGPLQPYVEGGVAFRTLQGVSQTLTSEGFICFPLTSLCVDYPTPVTTTTSHPSELSHSFTKGVTAGAGLEVRAPLVGVFGEVRYTYWTAEAFSAPSGLLNSIKNQADVLVGVTF